MSRPHASAAPGQGGAPPGPGLTRRRAFRAALGAAGAVAAGSALAGCGTSFERLAAAASRPAVLTWQPWYGFPTAEVNATAPVQQQQRQLQQLMQEAIQAWAATEGVQVQVLPPATSSTTTVASMLAGTGPDVFWDVNLPLFAQQGLVLDLQPYVVRDQIDVTVYTQAQMDYIGAAGAGQPGGAALFALPATVEVLAIGLYQGALDALGLTYPEPDWTAAQWAGLWASASVRAQGQAGGQLAWGGYDSWGANPSPFYLKGYGGEYVDPADPARCGLDQAASQAALQWCYGQILAGTCLGSSRSVVQPMILGQVVSGPLGTSGELYDAARNWSSTLGKWDLYAMPAWPQGRLTGASSDFYAVWSGTRSPDLAWALVRYLCVGTDWQSLMMQMALAGPNQKALWNAWAELARQYASPLAHKNLNAYLDAVAGDQLYVGLPFRYNEQQVAGVLGSFGAEVLSGRATVAAAAQQSATQIDGIEAAGAAAEAAAAAALRKLGGSPPSSSSAGASGPAPAGSGPPGASG